LLKYLRQNVDGVAVTEKDNVFANGVFLKHLFHADGWRWSQFVRWRMMGWFVIYMHFFILRQEWKRTLV